MGFVETVVSWQKRLRFDSHHAIERFTVFVALFATSLVVIVAGTVVTSVANNAEQLSQKAIYTNGFATSRTDISGSVAGVYVSPGRTRALVMMDFGDRFSKNMSLSAENYQTFLTAVDAGLVKQRMVNRVAGSVVVFGSSGFFGVVLESDAPFVGQILSITVRANSELVYTGDQVRAIRTDLRDDASFLEYDQWRVYVNPGAGEAVESAGVADWGEAFSPRDAFYHLVVRPKEQVLRAGLDDLLAQMQVDLASVAEYTAQLESVQVAGVRLLPPEVPVPIRGDWVGGVRQIVEGDGGQVFVSDESDPLVLHTDWVPARGYGFDWRNGSVKDGYLLGLVPEGETYVTFLAKKRAGEILPAQPPVVEPVEVPAEVPVEAPPVEGELPADSDSVGVLEEILPEEVQEVQPVEPVEVFEPVGVPEVLPDPVPETVVIPDQPSLPVRGVNEPVDVGVVSEEEASFSVNRIVWLLSDGTDLVKDYRNSGNTMKPLTDVMNNLSQAYQAYYRDKIRYQTRDLQALIDLEVSLLNVSESVSVNSADNAVLVY